jgi:translation initiation factor 2B subunit (eIF-2B alpha/beta/delta family)
MFSFCFQITIELKSNKKRESNKQQQRRKKKRIEAQRERFLIDLIRKKSSRREKKIFTAFSLSVLVRVIKSLSQLDSCFAFEIRF